MKRFTCKGELLFGGETLEIPFDYSKILQHLGAENFSNIDGGIASIELEADPTLGIYKVPNLDPYELTLLNATGSSLMATFGISADGSELGWFGFKEDFAGDTVLVNIVEIATEGGIPNQIFVEGDDGSVERFIVPVHIGNGLDSFQRMGLNWPMQLLMLLLILGSLQKRMKNLHLRRTASMIALLFMASIGLQAQKSIDCEIPSNWLDTSVYPFMDRVAGHCPTCVDSSVYEHSAKLWFCSNLLEIQATQEVEKLKAENPELKGKIAEQETLIAGLQAANTALLAQLKNQRNVEEPQLAQEHSKQQSPSVVVIVGGSTNNNVNPNANQQVQREADANVVAVEAKVDSIPPKPKLGYVSLFGGRSDAALSTFAGTQCFCPNETIGANEVADGLGSYGLQVGLAPDYSKLFSAVVQLHLMQVSNLEFEQGNAVRSYVPDFSRVQLGMVVTP